MKDLSLACYDSTSSPFKFLILTLCMYFAVVTKTLWSAMSAYFSRMVKASAMHSEDSSKSCSGTYIDTKTSNREIRKRLLAKEQQNRLKRVL